MPYTTICADPPWPESGGGRVKRGADRHYKLIKRREDILRTMLQSGVWEPADNAHLYLWATDNYMTWAFWLIDALGFKHKRCLPWVKPSRMGLGQYFRGCHELLLFAVRGSGKSVCKDGVFRTDELVGIPLVTDENGKAIHSAKPAEAYDLIEERSEGPYLEMFARAQRPGWTVWGDQA